MEYSLPELQAPRSNVADKPWPQVHSHTQRPHGVKTHSTRTRLTCTSSSGFVRTEQQHSLVSAGVRGHGERGASKAGGKGKRPVQHAEDPAAEHDFLGCMSRWSFLRSVQRTHQIAANLVMIRSFTPSPISSPHSGLCRVPSFRSPDVQASRGGF